MRYQSRQLICLLLLIISGSLMMAAQTYHINPVITPSTVIDGQSMAACFPTELVAISPTGEVAFATGCAVAFLQNSEMVFTSHHIVARDGDVIDGKEIHISSFSPPTINSQGQVAYEVMWLPVGKDPDDGRNWLFGICVDRHLVQALPPDTNISSLTLSDDGKVTYNQPLQSTAPAVRPAPPKTPSAVPAIIHQIPFKLPKNVPIGIPNVAQNPFPQPPKSVDAAHPVVSLPQFASNSKGQLVIPTTLPGDHFSILIATPAN
jgi:hypothetical protein